MSLSLNSLNCTANDKIQTHLAQLLLLARHVHLLGHDLTQIKFILLDRLGRGAVTAAVIAAGAAAAALLRSCVGGQLLQGSMFSVCIRDSL